MNNKILAAATLGVGLGYKVRENMEKPEPPTNITINNTFNTSVPEGQPVNITQSPANITLSSTSNKTTDVSIPIKKTSVVDVPINVNKGKVAGNKMEGSSPELNSILESSNNFIDSYLLFMDNLLGFKSVFCYFFPLIAFYLLYLKLNIIFYIFLRNKMSFKHYLIDFILNGLKKLLNFQFLICLGILTVCILFDIYFYFYH
jgi:hypothetical protein